MSQQAIKFLVGAAMSKPDTTLAQLDEAARELNVTLTVRDVLQAYRELDVEEIDAASRPRVEAPKQSSASSKRAQPPHMPTRVAGNFDLSKQADRDRLDAITLSFFHSEWRRPETFKIGGVSSLSLRASLARLVASKKLVRQGQARGTEYRRAGAAKKPSTKAA